MDNKVAFSVVKNVIIEQNKELLKLVAERYNLDYDVLIDKYLTPTYYLPVVQNTNEQKRSKK